MDQQEPQTPQAQDPWIIHADKLKQKMEDLLAAQLHEYEVMNAKLEEWKQNPGQSWLTQADYDPWQAALRNLELAQREFDAHISTRVKK